MSECIMCSEDTSHRVLGEQPLCAACADDDRRFLHAVKFAKAMKRSSSTERSEIE